MSGSTMELVSQEALAGSLSFGAWTFFGGAFYGKLWDCLCAKGLYLS